MADRHASPMLGWHPPAELSAWARAEAERSDVSLSTILTAALDFYRSQCGDSARERCIYCGRRTYEPGWGCHVCGMAAPLDEARASSTPDQHQPEEGR